MILPNINSPQDVKALTKKQLPTLAKEIRKTILEVVGKNGGHLASNLGAVELTIALHRVFESPKDAIIFDVSHQSYTHKLLTGRYKDFKTIRQKGGISGFTRIAESEHDFFDAGHASTSISSAYGLLTSWDILEKEGKVVAVIGDGALTGGLAFEALSNAGQTNRNLIVILNDNQMSISKNTGAISEYLSKITMTKHYQRFRHFVDVVAKRVPFFSSILEKLIFRLRRGLKGLLFSNNLFSDLGFDYVGPLDGHNISGMEKVFRQVKELHRPVVVHVITKKGCGYSPAENDPATFHGIGPFSLSDGKVEKFNALSYTEAFCNALMEIAAKRSELDNGKRSNSLSDDRRRILHGTMNAMEAVSKALAQAGDPDGAEAFEVMRKCFNGRRSEYLERVKTMDSELENMFSFAEEVFGDGQEMLIIVTELTKGAYSARYISRHGCKKYFEHNKELLFYERQSEILKEIEGVDI